MLSREFILERVWGWNFIGDSRTVDVHIRWLREKIESRSLPTQSASSPSRGAGYRFDGLKESMKKFNLLRSSLLWRIALPYAILILVMMGLVAGYLYFSLRGFYTQQVSERLLAEARISSEDLACDGCRRSA